MLCSKILWTEVNLLLVYYVT